MRVPDNSESRHKNIEKGEELRERNEHDEAKVLMRAKQNDGADHKLQLTFFKGEDISLRPFRLFGEPVERAREVTLLPEGVPGFLGCGVFEMERNGFSLTYPREEIMMILAGEIEVTVAGEQHVARTGDILRVPGGLEAELHVPDRVRILYVSSPGAEGQEK
jgi:uncharacterized cupin superfamily protein